MSSGTSLAELLASESTPNELAARVARKGLKGRLEFLAVLDADLDVAIRELESLANHYHEDEEEKLTAVIAIQLRRLGYLATNEEPVRGHVDLKVELVKLNLLWLGEAKIHTAYATTADGLRQLMDRYSSGRDTHAGVLLYIRNSNAVAVVKKWRAHLEREKTCGFVCLGAQDNLWFVSEHDHTAGQRVTVKHRGVLMYYAPTDKSARSSRRKGGGKKTVRSAKK